MSITDPLIPGEKADGAAGGAGQGQHRAAGLFSITYLSPIFPFLRMQCSVHPSLEIDGIRLTVVFAGGTRSCPGGVGEGEGGHQGFAGAAAIWQGEPCILFFFSLLWVLCQ